MSIRGIKVVVQGVRGEGGVDGVCEVGLERRGGVGGGGGEVGCLVPVACWLGSGRGSWFVGFLEGVLARGAEVEWRRLGVDAAMAGCWARGWCCGVVPSSGRLRLPERWYAPTGLWSSYIVVVGGERHCFCVRWKGSTVPRVLLPLDPRTVDVLLNGWLEHRHVSPWDHFAALPPLIDVYLGHRPSIVVVNTSDSDEPVGPM